MQRLFATFLAILLISSATQADSSSRAAWSVVPHVSGPMRGHVARQVLPEYPELLRAKGVTGIVQMCIEVSRSGRVASVSVVEGPEELLPYASAAVRKWRFQPLYIDGKAVRVVMPIAFTFSVAGVPDPSMSRPTSACSGARAARLRLSPSRAPADA